MSTFVKQFKGKVHNLWKWTGCLVKREQKSKKKAIKKMLTLCHKEGTVGTKNIGPKVH
jgi:hypothetical protein